MTDNAYNVTDLIKFSAGQNPIDFEQAFNSLMVDRIQAAVDAKKVEVAQNMFAGEAETEEEFESEESEPELEDNNDGETA